MAELPHIGKHCAHQECRQLDYLSIGCTGCSQAFCKDHFPFDNHQCSRKYLKKSGKRDYFGVKGYGCSLGECKNRELTEVICEFCENNFCLEHRHQVDHSCSKLENPSQRMAATREHVQAIVNKSATSSKSKGRGHKSKAMAAKVALMKIKMKAVGDKAIPDTERVYINVNLPKGSKNSNKAVYFSKQWSFGRVVDDIASRAQLENKNNVATAKKLKLFDCDTGLAFSFDKYVYESMDQELLFSGSTLTMEYVEPGVEILGDNRI